MVTRSGKKRNPARESEDIVALLSEKGPEDIPGDLERLLTGFEAALEGPVLHFDADRTLVAGIGEDGEKAGPIDFTHAGKLGRMVIEWRRQNPHLV